MVVSQEKKSFFPGLPMYLLINIFLYFLLDVFGGPHERRLLNDLMEHYNTLERPVYNESEPLQLLFGLTLQQIIDVVSMEHSILVGSPPKYYLLCIQYLYDYCKTCR